MTVSRIIYISPHLDDVALSCGGLVWEQVQAGNRVQIWTICAGDPPKEGISQFAQGLHRRWGAGESVYEVRRTEDKNSCAVLGAEYVHWDYQDCIYRIDQDTGIPFYDSEEALRAGLSLKEGSLVRDIASRLISSSFEDDILICPLAIGGHVDHLLARKAAESIHKKLVYYQDFPYVANYGFEDTQIPKRSKPRRYQLSNSGLEIWYESIIVHRSQISTFWANPENLRIAITQYYSNSEGIILWEQD